MVIVWQCPDCKKATELSLDDKWLKELRGITTTCPSCGKSSPVEVHTEKLK